MTADEAVLRAAEEFAREVFADDTSGHDVSHTLRVSAMAARLAEAEGADVSLARLAALLHDVDDYKLSPATSDGLDRAGAFLRANVGDEARVQAVLGIIREVSFRGTDSVVPKTMEGKCVQDADRLDAMGALGIARAFAYGGSRGRVMHDPDLPPNPELTAEEYRTRESTTVNHFYEKLLLLKDRMNTDAAKQIAGRRDQYMRDFLREFFAEWDGTR